MQRADQPSADKTTRQASKWYYSISFVLLMLFLLGPFGLSLLWRSDKFNLSVKVILTLIMAILTVLVIISTTALIKKTFDYFQSINSLLE